MKIDGYGPPPTGAKLLILTQGGVCVIGSWAAGGGFWAGKCPINDGETLGMEGATELIAIARCYVASVMGETVEVPEELL